MPPDAPLVLIVDDEQDLRDLLDFNLKQASYRTVHAATGSEALMRAQADGPDVILLDLNLPDVGGTEVCRRLKADPATHPVPILMLTARGSETDRIVGLELGADDYVVKPFSVRELVLRVNAICRRASARRHPEQQRGRVLGAGPVEIDRDAFIVRVHGQEIALALLEFRLLEYLMEGAGRVQTREGILEHVWGYNSDIETRTIDTHVKRVRDKLGDAASLIETVRGVGFRIREL